MTTVSGVGSRAMEDMDLWSDPEVAAEYAVMTTAVESRNNARAERRMAQADEQAQQESRAAHLETEANMKLASGLVEGASEVAQGAATMHEAGMQMQSASMRARADALESPDATSAQRTSARDLRAQATMIDARSKGVEGSATLTGAVGKMSSMGLTRVADAEQAQADRAEQEATRAHERTDAAGDRVHDAAAQFERMSGAASQSIAERGRIRTALIQSIRA